MIYGLDKPAQPINNGLSFSNRSSSAISEKYSDINGLCILPRKKSKRIKN